MDRLDLVIREPIALGSDSAGPDERDFEAEFVDKINEIVDWINEVESMINVRLAEEKAKPCILR